MSLRSNIEKCIVASASPDEAARLICGYLYDINLAEPGNGWFADDPEMEDGGLSKAWEAWTELSKA